MRPKLLMWRDAVSPGDDRKAYRAVGSAQPPRPRIRSTAALPDDKPMTDAIILLTCSPNLATCNQQPALIPAVRPSHCDWWINE